MVKMVKAMRKYLSYFFLLCLLLVIYFSRAFSFISQEVLHNFLFTILPSLAPSMLFDYLFLHSGGLYYLYQFFKKKKGKNAHAIYRNLIILLGLFSGTPTLASYVEESIQKGFFSKQEGEMILSCYLLPSFPFIFGILLPHFSLRMKIILLVLLYVPNTLFYFLQAKKFKEEKEEVFSLPSEENYVSKAIFSTANTCLLLLGSMLLFSFPFLLLKKIPSPLLSYGLYGFFEFTNSTLYFVNHLSQLSFAILLIILSFSSLSVYTQVYLLAPSLRIRKILKKRLLFTGVNVFLILIFFLLQVF